MIHDPLGIKLLTSLTVGLSHLNEHWFRHIFQDCLNPLCSCSLKVESNIHSFLHCQHFIQSRQTLLDSVTKIVNISNLTDDALVNLLLYGSQTLNFEENSTIIKASIKYILSTERFSGPLIWPFNISNYIKSINICIWSYPFLQTLIWTIRTVKCCYIPFLP